MIANIGFEDLTVVDYGWVSFQRGVVRWYMSRDKEQKRGSTAKLKATGCVLFSASCVHRKTKSVLAVSKCPATNFLRLGRSLLCPIFLQRLIAFSCTKKHYISK
jgi:hypothetical protein